MAQFPEAMFRPRSVAFFGASDRLGSVGRTVVRNLLGAGFQGSIWLVNPRHTEISGHKCWPDAQSLPDTPDLAIIATPPQTVPRLVSDIGARGTRAIVIITAGVDTDAVLKAAEPFGTRIIGPNCFGLMIPPLDLNSSFGHLDPPSGNLAFISQSGAIISAVIDWSRRENIGFSAIVSMGNMCDVDIGQTLQWLASDPQTSAVLMYLEELTDAAGFMAAARTISALKPVVVIKAGRHAEGAKAATSHTGALAGADDVYDAAFRQTGLVRIMDVEDLFDAAVTLSRLKGIPGNRIGIVTNGGGAGVLAVDRLIDCGGKVADLDTRTLEKLDRILPATWSRSNPVDIIGDAGPERYQTALKVVLEDPGVDAVLVTNCPTALASSMDAAKAVIETLETHPGRKPVLACWMGYATAQKARDLFARHNIPAYGTPEDAVRSLSCLMQYSQLQDKLKGTILDKAPLSGTDPEKAGSILMDVARARRTILNEIESKEILGAYGIPVVPTVQAQAPEEVETVAGLLLREGTDSLAVKILSNDITHKSDVGGVVLGICSAVEAAVTAKDILEKVRKARPDATILGLTVQPMLHMQDSYELILGIATDRTFGPTLLFGAGGTSAEVVADRAVALPPLDLVSAHELMARTRIHKLLKGYRNRPPADLDAIAETLVRLSHMAVEQPLIQELDINPLLAGEKGVIALDARIVVRQKR
ncbi:MAG: acetate--CoA ligase family protein [Pseudomonadota bacterium]|nr:acetate--CoA ligase family protein [Pseudomonadota bacterium]